MNHYVFFRNKQTGTFLFIKFFDKLIVSFFEIFSSFDSINFDIETIQGSISRNLLIILLILILRIFFLRLVIVVVISLIILTLISFSIIILLILIARWDRNFFKSWTRLSSLSRYTLIVCWSLVKLFRQSFRDRLRNLFFLIFKKI